MLQTTTNINIDFYDKKYILINAKQLDRKSRFLSITCYNHGEPCSFNNGEHSAYIRYKKADNNGVFNLCEIDRRGRIIVELTEQMLAADGICCADLVIVDKGNAKVDAQTGEIIGIENASILSTMPIHIDVTGVAVENSDIESSYEFNGLNTALEKAESEYAEVMQTSKSYAVGDAGGIRENEDYDNAKYYYEQSLNSSNNSAASALSAANSEENAESHMHDALTYSQNAQTYMTNAKTYMDNASTSETNAMTYKDAAYVSEQNAKTSEINALVSETNVLNSEKSAKNSEINAQTSAENAEFSESNALTYANRAQSYAVGGTGTRDNEDYDNAYYYYDLIKNIVVGLDSGFIPMGTVSFSELSSVEKATGYVYNISDDFVTDSSFAEGEGKSYTAGVNVYCRSDGLWDCFGGISSSTATVDEVKYYLGI